MSDREGAFGFQAGEPETIEQLLAQEWRRRRSREVAAGVEPPPENETAIEGFVRRTREQARREDEEARLRRDVQNANPGAPLERDRGDPLRELSPIAAGP